MPRRLRIEFEGAIYHVMARGNARQKIVRDDSDRRRLVDGLEHTVVRSGWELLCYVITKASRGQTRFLVICGQAEGGVVGSHNAATPSHRIRGSNLLCHGAGQCPREDRPQGAFAGSDEVSCNLWTS